MIRRENRGSRGFSRIWVDWREIMYRYLTNIVVNDLNNNFFEDIKPLFLTISAIEKYAKLAFSRFFAILISYQIVFSEIDKR